MSQLLTPEEAAERLQVSLSTVKRWLRSGELNGVKPGGRLWRVEEEALQQFIADSKKAGQEKLINKSIQAAKEKD